MAEGDVRVPAGWYPDPLGLPQLRWWDNHAWTEYTSDARQPMTAQDTVTQQPRLAFADDRPAETTASDGAAARTDTAKPTQDALLALEAPVRETQVVVEEELSPAAKFAEFVPANAPSTPAFDLGTRFDDLLGDAALPAEPVAARAASGATLGGAGFAGGTVGGSTLGGFDGAAFLVDDPAREETLGERRRDRRDEHGRRAAHTDHGFAADEARPASAQPSRGTGTGPAWVIALMPLFGLLAAMFLLVGQLGELAPQVLPFVAIVIPYFATIPLAYADTRILRGRGYHPAHWFFGLLGPAYLVARFVVLFRSTGRGFGPLLGGIGFVLLNLVAVIALPGIIISAAPTAFARSIEHSVEDQAATLGATIHVSCPDTPPTIVGQGFMCTAKKNLDDTIGWGINVKLERANGWFTWQVEDWGALFTLSKSLG